MNRRPRRNRKNEAIRSMNTETRLSVNNLIQPIFLVPGTQISEVIPSLPMAKRFSLDLAIEEVADCRKLGIDKFIIFPKIPNELKDKVGTYSYNSKNYYLEFARQVKDRFKDVVLISDVALDPYNIDGHDGIVKDGRIINDETVGVLSKMAM